ncbi:MAG: tetratricopeptide repeat protein [Phycisphaerales bacterium JB038]
MSIRCRVPLVLALAAPLALSACHSQRASSLEPAPATDAARLAEQAVEVMDADAEQAAAWLRQAISLDPYNASAYNNMGVLHLQAGRLFEAAESFEEARKLMPAHPSPRLNLGLVFERAGRYDDAITEYRKALEVAEGFVPAMQALARCQLCHDRTDETTAALLADLTIRGSTDQWQTWAREQSLRLSASHAVSR